MKREIILVAGSTAIDQTGHYAGDFEEYQARYPINALNLSFQLTEMHTSFGGCAPNIAWGLCQLGVKALPLSSAGRNFEDRYSAHLRANNIETKYIAIDENSENSASCVMVNDSVGNQIIGFYPGPDSSKRKLPSEITEIDSIALAILGPEVPTLCLRQARDLARIDVPFVFDPGQVVGDYKRNDILELLSLADYLILNNHEFGVLQTNGKLTAEDIYSKVSEVVVTNGAEGVDLVRGTKALHVQAVNGVEIIDVTGCGDAFRAGYLYGVINQFDTRTRAELGCIMAVLNLQTSHTQNYRTDLKQVMELKEHYYGQH